MQGLSIYADVTQSPSWASKLRIILSTTVNSSLWTGSDGIIIEDAKSSATPTTFTNDVTCGFKAIYIRGLFEMWIRMSDSMIQDFLRSYITVQLNALLDLARLPGTNQFSSSWPGPYPLNLDACSQYAALDVFNAAIGLVSVTDNTTSTSPTSSPDSQTSTNVGLIIAVTVAAVVLSVALLAGFILWSKRRSRRASERKSETADINPFDPFVLDGPGTLESLESPRHRHTGKARPSHFRLGHHENTANTAVRSGGSLSRSEMEGSSSLPLESVSCPSCDTPVEEGTADLTKIPQLIHRLNRALAGLPSKLVIGETLPAYDVL
ncbi:hypothetical protein NLI96_g10694 [Meripilus lineatus]|uniref:Uncharacterized protein n=1 Tax=Meripilus lineatus TaxID=2056292 RepID=A0AAD5UXQ7_9APHY|nr:hypothetical protein NLI96_g10694 [Physisporinus lineatus]